MNRHKEGFTLIELVVVIVIIGILAAVAIPKYVDLTAQAKRAHDDGILAGLRTATVLLYATNVIAGATNVYGSCWPTETQVTNQMSEAYTWLYYTPTVPTYNPTSGVWTAIIP